jgi:hypothetical protein
MKTMLNFLTLTAGMALLLSLAGAPGVRAADTATNDLPFPLIDRFENIRMQDGMPTHKAHCVLRASDGKLWVGTYGGALVREDGKFRRIGVEDGLSHKMVLCMVEDKRIGDMWIGTMRGLNRYSAGRITSYLQTTCGLPNNVVCGVEEAWFATSDGLSHAFFAAPPKPAKVADTK